MQAAALSPQPSTLSLATFLKRFSGLEGDTNRDTVGSSKPLIGMRLRVGRAFSYRGKIKLVAIRHAIALDHHFKE